jgi:glycerol-1-phosphate dehydrogenase [NAD(P)+]
MTGDSKALLERAVAAASVTRVVEVAPGALASLPAVFARVFAGRRATIVADGNTMAAAGERAAALLAASGVALGAPEVFPGQPRLEPATDIAHALGVRLRDAGTVPVAVGSGVINDVAKYAAGIAATPYLCVPTAASMDGYAASGASMLDGDFKRTLGCPPPLAVVADLDLVASAPAPMAAWGYGDLSGKLVAGADWLLADALGIEPIAPGPFALVQDHVRGWLADPAGIAAGDRRALGGLVDGLLISGFAMQAHGNSRPASGSDHQLAHVWEMDGLSIDGVHVAHGACVGVAAVAMLAAWEWLLARDVPAQSAKRAQQSPPDWQAVEDEVAAAFEPSLAQGARAEMAAKRVDATQWRARLARLGMVWPELCERARARLVPAATLAGWLAACGAATRPEDIGLPLARLIADCRRARLIRRRYTLLDCLDDLGWLDAALAALPDAYRAMAAQMQASPPRGMAHAAAAGAR